MATNQELAQAAAQVLNRFPDAASSQRLAQPVRDYLAQATAFLQDTTQATNLDSQQLDALTTQSEWSLLVGRVLAGATNTLEAISTPSTLISLRDCLNDCERAHSRCISRIDPVDRPGKIICNIESTACVARCLVELGQDVFSASGISTA